VALVGEEGGVECAVDVAGAEAKLATRGLTMFWRIFDDLFGMKSCDPAQGVI